MIVHGDPSRGRPALFTGAMLRLLSGRAAGRELACMGQTTEGVLIVTAGPGGDPRLFEGVEPGDEILVDNRKGLAAMFWDRHHVEFPAYPERRHHVVDGRPLYPQRPRSPYLKRGPEYLYEFSGHMIIVQNTHDRGTWPVGPIRYEQMARARMGPRFDERFRVWWNDHASHLPAEIQPMGSPPVITTREVDYGGSVQQAVTDLIDWVERGKEPPESSRYEWDEGGRFALVATAAERKGIQPVVSATANGAVKAVVRVGEPVAFAAVAEVPPGAGTIVSAEWDFEGTGQYPLRYENLGGTSAERFEATYSYARPGTYFPALRVVAQREGDAGTSLRRVPNLGRLRVVVEEG